VPDAGQLETVFSEWQTKSPFVILVKHVSTGQFEWVDLHRE